MGIEEKWDLFGAKNIYKSANIYNVLKTPTLLEAQKQRKDALIFDLNIQDNDMNTIALHIRSNIQNVAEEIMGKTKEFPKKPPVPWWSEETAKVIRFRKNALKKFLRYPSQENLEDYIIRRDNAREVIRDAKTNSWRSYTETIAPDTPPTELWGKIRAISGKSTRKQITQIQTNDGTINNPWEIANSIGDHFVEVSADSQWTDRALIHKTRIGNILQSQLIYQQDNTIHDYNGRITVFVRNHPSAGYSVCIQPI